MSKWVFDKELAGKNKKSIVRTVIGALGFVGGYSFTSHTVSVMRSMKGTNAFEEAGFLVLKVAMGLSTAAIAMNGTSTIWDAVEEGLKEEEDERDSDA